MRTNAVIVVLLILACALTAQVQTPRTSAEIVAAVTDAAGGRQALAALKDFRATGDIEYFDTNDEPKGLVTLRGLGIQTLRCDIVIGGETRSWFVQGLAGSSKWGDAKPKPLPVEFAANFQHFVLPWAALAKAPERAKTAPKRESDPAQLTRLTLDSSPPHNHSNAHSNAPKGPSVELAVDTASNQVQSVSSLVGKRGKTATVKQEFLFSDYRAVNGVMFPFTIEERVNGQRAYVIHLQDVSTNVGLALADLNF